LNVGAREVDRVGDDEQVFLVVFDLGERARRHAILDCERVKLKHALEDVLDFLGSRIVHVDPEQQALVGAHETQRLEFKVLADHFAVAEDERADHGARRGAARRF
jgi:hypothetical protein